MAGLVEGTAARLGWEIAKGNVLVEGASDVRLVRFAASKYRETHGVELLGSELSILAAGQGDDGGVQGVNRRLTLMRQLSAAEVAPDERPKFNFIGLYDNDKAGRDAVAAQKAADSRMREGAELFKLRPVMPLRGGAAPSAVLDRFKRENEQWWALDWEIEDFIGPEIWRLFEIEEPNAVRKITTLGGRIHRDMGWDEKHRFWCYVRDYARLDDLSGIVGLIRALRDYVGLQADHIVL